LCSYSPTAILYLSFWTLGRCCWKRFGDRASEEWP
jgi:hypothetical protein